MLCEWKAGRNYKYFSREIFWDAAFLLIAGHVISAQCLILRALVTFTYLSILAIRKKSFSHSLMGNSIHLASFSIPDGKMGLQRILIYLARS